MIAELTVGNKFSDTTYAMPIRRSVPSPKQADPIVAFVLSGGGVRGAVQCGALIALNERGVTPHLVAGTSAGALNGAAYCLMPGLVGLGHLATLWRMTKRDDVWPGHPLSWAWRLIAGELGFGPKPLGLVSHTHLIGYIEKALDFVVGRHDLTFADLEIRLFVTAVDVVTRVPMILGDLDESLVFSIAASAAMPGISDPVPFMDTLLTDGGVTNPLPLDIAIQRGATEIYAIDLSGVDTPYRPANILEKLLADFNAQQMELAAQGIRDAQESNITLHHLDLGFDVDLLDFSRAQEMIEHGYKAMRDYLNDPHPLRMRE